MDVLPDGYFRRGDKVLVSDECSGWSPARVISADRRVRVAHSLSRMRVESMRLLPVGTPVYDSVSSRDIRFVAHDPGWDPYTVSPFLTPDQYEVLAGIPRSALGWTIGRPHVGAYIPGVSYRANDPAWAWEDCGWRPCVVINGQRSWVTVRFLDGFRSSRNRSSKSYRPAQVWPVLCDFPKPVLTLDETGWSDVGQVV